MKKHSLKYTDLPVLLAFALFALCGVLVLLIGVRLYGKQVEEGQRRYDRRTAAQYLTTRIRQADTLELDLLGDCQAVSLGEETGDGSYRTLVYCWEGTLRELYCQDPGRFSPEDGEILLPVERLAFSLEGNLLRAVLGEDTLLFCLPEGMEVGP